MVLLFLDRAVLIGGGGVEGGGGWNVKTRTILDTTSALVIPILLRIL